MSPEIVPFVQTYHMYFFFCILHFIFLYFCGWLLIHPPVMSPEMAAFVRAWKRGLASHGGGNWPPPRLGSSRICTFSPTFIRTKKLPTWRLPPQIFTLFSISGHFRGGYLWFPSFSCLQLWSQQIIWSWSVTIEILYLEEVSHCGILRQKWFQTKCTCILHFPIFRWLRWPCPKMWMDPMAGSQDVLIFWRLSPLTNDWINLTEKCLDELRVDAHVPGNSITGRILIIAGCFQCSLDGSVRFDPSCNLLAWWISHVDQNKFFCI